ncbi:MAG: glycosyltransferase, partial [Bacteroidetes bacterium]
ILLSTVEQLVMVSRSEAEELTSLFAIKKEYVSVIQNIVECYDAGSETQEPDGINKILKEYRVPFKICMIGRNDPVKNYPLAFETIRLFLDETKEKALFVLVGISHDDAALRRLREEYLENIIVLEQSNGASTILSYCNALLITSKKEGCPLVVLESFCCGKPVVGTNVPGIYDLVTDGINGLLCPQNARELSKALHRLIEDGNLYQTLSDNARAYGSAMNTRDWAMEYFRLYKTLLNK